MKLLLVSCLPSQYWRHFFLLIFHNINQDILQFTDSNLSLFGKSLESYVDNERKSKITNICTTMERGSKNSIAALFRIGDDLGSMDSHKQSDIVCTIKKCWFI